MSILIIIKHIVAFSPQLVTKDMVKPTNWSKMSMRPALAILKEVSTSYTKQTSKI